MTPLQGGSDSRTPETTGKLQLLQQFAIPGVVGGNSDPSKKGTPIYMGMESHLSRIEDEKTKKQKKKGDVVEGYKKEKHNKRIRKLEDGLLLVVSARIHGKMFEH